MLNYLTKVNDHSLFESGSDKTLIVQLLDKHAL